jgi:2-methoxy-6-polyprenyl-1,4-benzoquinol methylase
VEVEQKQKLVGEVFSSVAGNYDIMNDAMSFGIHRCWKDQFVGMLGPLKPHKVKCPETGEVKSFEPMRVLDVAGGTGDITFRMLNKAREDSQGYDKLGVDITMTDINADMLEVGKKNAIEKNHFHDLKF